MFGGTTFACWYGADGEKFVSTALDVTSQIEDMKDLESTTRQILIPLGNVDSRLEIRVVHGSRLSSDRIDSVVPIVSKSRWVPRMNLGLPSWESQQVKDFWMINSLSIQMTMCNGQTFGTLVPLLAFDDRQSEETGQDNYPMRSL
jgi:hypothetical protein